MFYSEPLSHPPKKCVQQRYLRLHRAEPIVSCWGWCPQPIGGGHWLYLYFLELGSQISFPTMQSQNTALTCLSPRQKPRQGIESKIPAPSGISTCIPQSKQAGVEISSKQVSNLSTAGLSKVGIEIPSSVPVHNSAVWSKNSWPALLPWAINPAG